MSSFTAMFFDQANYFVGPLELTRRTKHLVWDDEVESTELETPNVFNAPLSASPRPSVNTLPLPPRTRSQSASDGFPPPTRRATTEASRPVPFSAKFQKVHRSVTGVTVLEHLERLDAVEASLKRLGRGDNTVIEEEEVDVGESTKPASIRGPSSLPTDPAPSQFTPPGSPPLVPVLENMALENSVTEDDIVALSKSMSYAEGSPSDHSRWASMHGRQQEGGSRALDWMQTTDMQAETHKRSAVVEVYPTPPDFVLS
jgi:phosphatidylinositol 4-kinase type 2